MTKHPKAESKTVAMLEEVAGHVRYRAAPDRRAQVPALRRLRGGLETIVSEFARRGG